MAMHPNIRLKRVYEPPQKADGYRVLVDRLWPRGIKKEDAHLDEWNKELAPSSALRKWFHQKGGTFEEFSERYRDELKEKEAELARIREISKHGNVTLVYAARDAAQNHAIVLQDALNRLRT